MKLHERGLAMSKILIVEDEESIADLEKDYLELSGFEVEVANDGETGLRRGLAVEFDLIILDLMLPKMNGYEVLSSLRKDGNDVPVLILSARTELDDKIQGFTVGADDYVTKPFEIQELLMRIQAISRRRIHHDILRPHAGNLSFDSNTCEISNTSTGKSMKISGKEMQLCEFLLINQNQVLEKSRLQQKYGDMIPTQNITMWKFIFLFCAENFTIYRST